MNKIIKYSFFIALLFLIGCNGSSSTMPSLKESYSYVDNNPFGTSVAFSMVKNAYPDYNFAFFKSEFNKEYDLTNDTASLYINFSKNYLPNDEALSELMDFVYRGNTAFISSSRIDTALLGQLYCKQNIVGNSTFDFMTFYENASTQIAKEIEIYKDSFSYFYKGFYNTFPIINNDNARYIGKNKEGKVNMFTFFYGKGKFVFHAEPRAFSNYFLLTNNNYLYMQSVLKLLPQYPEHVYWDNYYAKKNIGKRSKGAGGRSLTDTVSKSSSLLFAFLATLALFVFYLLFNSKRKQRIVPIKKQNENSSIAFAEAIAGLYLNKKDNKVIVEKMITFFNEHIRTKYFFSLNINDTSYADVLSRKSGVPFDITNELTTNIRQSNARLKITDEELLNLNALIEKFLKHKK